MSALEERSKGLPRPYTQGTFQSRLDKFEDLIKEITLQDVEASPEERRQMITENLRFDQFCDSIRALFGSDIRNNDLKAIYRKITTNPDAKVDWSELFGYFQSDIVEEPEMTVGEEVNVFTISAKRRVGEAAGDRKRRDVVVRMRYIPSLDSYLVTSQKGSLSVWSSKLRLTACTDIYESSWVTGCDYLRNMRRVVTCTERSICIWDNRAKGKNQQVYSIKPIENSPQCVTWVPRTTSLNEDTVLYGDDQGYVNLLVINAKDLTAKTTNKTEQRPQYSPSVTIDPKKLTHSVRRRKLHDDWVLKVEYFPELRCFASCSPCSTSSFVLEEVEQLYNDGEVRSVSIPKGVNAFVYCARANILASGGVDKIIRVWHPHIFARPTGKLLGHLFTITDITCNEKDQHLISLSTARVIRIWDIHTLTSLQVFTDNEERPGERRIYSMIFDNKHDQLLTGSSVVDVWPLTRALQDTMQVPHTHDRPINQVAYNSELNQVLTLCTESVFKIWDGEHGRLVYQIVDAHGAGIEVTAVAFDSTGYRLVSGGLDGSIKVWDFGSGQEIKSKPGRGADEDLSIMGLQYCGSASERCIIALGWNNKLRLLQDSNESYDLQVLKDFVDVCYLVREPSLPPNGNVFSPHTPLPSIGSSAANVTGFFKKEYVLSSYELTCISALLPDLLATGCSDGSLILWDIKNASVNSVHKLPSPQGEEGRGIQRSKSLSRGRSMLGSTSSKAVNVIKFLVHRVRRLDPAYIKKLTHFEESKEEEESDGEEAENRSSPVTSHRNPVTTSPVGDETREEELMVETGGDATGVPESAVKSQPNTSRVAIDDGITTKMTNQDTTRDDDDPDTQMIVDSFPAVLVTCHQDAFIRFWSLEGAVLREVSAMTRRQGSAVTALCHDNDCHTMVTGDHKGYLTLWDVSKFLQNPDSQDTDGVKQVICWRAHLTRVVQLEYIQQSGAILSGSTDGSVRVWWGNKASYVGFLGQHRPLSFPTAAETTRTPLLPYDINEAPLEAVKTISARNKTRPQQPKYEYPLIFDTDRWKPFRRSAHVREQDPTLSEPGPTRHHAIDKKFFEALIKPRPGKNKLESSTTGEMRQGAVFRALPVYRVRTPDKPKTPQLSYSTVRENKPVLMATQPQLQKTVKLGGRTDKKTRRNTQYRNPMLSHVTSFSGQSPSPTTTISMSSPRRH